MTLLHVVARRVDYGEYKDFFEECFKYSQHHINSKTDHFYGGKDKTPIHFAAESGYVKNVKYLMEHGANIHDPDNSGRTALFCAAFAGTSSKPNEALEVIELLVKHGADVKVKDRFTGDTPLHIAASGFHDKSKEIIACLVQKGGDINAKNKRDFTPIMYAVQSNYSLNVADFPRHLEIVNWLIEKRVDTNHRTVDEGESLLTLCRKRNHNNQYDEIIKILKDKDDDFRESQNTTSKIVSNRSELLI